MAQVSINTLARRSGTNNNAEKIKLNDILGLPILIIHAKITKSSYANASKNKKKTMAIFYIKLLEEFDGNKPIQDEIDLCKTYFVCTSRLNLIKFAEDLKSITVDEFIKTILVTDNTIESKHNNIIYMDFPTNLDIHKKYVLNKHRQLEIDEED